MKMWTIKRGEKRHENSLTSFYKFKQAETKAEGKWAKQYDERIDSVVSSKNHTGIDQGKEGNIAK